MSGRCWEDHDRKTTIATYGPVEVAAVPQHRADHTGITSSVRHYLWLHWPERHSIPARELAAHLLAAADHLDRLNQQD